jgi:hypothetical protein
MAHPAATTHSIYRRRTDASNWERVPQNLVRDVVVGVRETPNLATGQRDGPGSGVTMGSILKGVRVDDWVFGVSSVSKNGFESPVASAVPGGAFKPYVAPPPQTP